VERAIANKTGRTNFKIEKIVIEDGDWVLALASSNRQDDRGNRSFYVLEKDGSSYRVVSGPSTAFGADELADAGVPDSVIKYFAGDDQGVIWIGFNEGSPMSTHSSSFIKMVETAIALYCRAANLDLKHAALEKDSWKDDVELDDHANTVSISRSFSVVLNTRHKLLVNITEKSSSLNISLQRDSNVVFEAIADLSKRFVTIGKDPALGGANRLVSTNIFTITTEDLKYDSDKLPPLKSGDRVSLYYIYPTNDQVGTRKIYKYNFYY
jgi:hypothetical protein